MRRGWKNQRKSQHVRARHADSDPIRASPYKPAAYEQPLHEAGHTKAPDHMHEPKEKTLAFHGPFKHDSHVCRVVPYAANVALRVIQLPPLGCIRPSSSWRGSIQGKRGRAGAGNS